jgi:hypothetical protein
VREGGAMVESSLQIACPQGGTEVVLPNEGSPARNGRLVDILVRSHKLDQETLKYRRALAGIEAGVQSRTDTASRSRFDFEA